MGRRRHRPHRAGRGARDRAPGGDGALDGGVGGCGGDRSTPGSLPRRGARGPSVDARGDRRRLGGARPHAEVVPGDARRHEGRDRGTRPQVQPDVAPRRVRRVGGGEDAVPATRQLDQAVHAATAAVERPGQEVRVPGTARARRQRRRAGASCRRRPRRRPRSCTPRSRSSPSTRPATTCAARRTTTTSPRCVRSCSGTRSASFAFRNHRRATPRRGARGPGSRTSRLSRGCARARDRRAGRSSVHRAQ